MEMTKQLLLNLSLLLVILFFFQIHLDRKDISELPRRLSMYYFMLSILVCIFLTNKVFENLYFDLRQVPLIVGTLYLGTGWQLLSVIILARSLLGIDLGFWISVSIFTLFTLFSCLGHTFFLRQKKHHRMLVSVSYSIGLSLMIMGATSYFFGIYHSIETWIGFVFIPAICTFIMAYTIETINRNLYLRQQIEKTKKMEAVTHMAAAISHEIRNPLTSAKGFVQFVSEDDNLAQTQKEYLSIALQELNQAETVIRDYLTFSKPSIISVEEINVSEELNNTLKILQPLSNLNSVQVKTDLTLPGQIQGDRHKFHQCFFNIIKNCIEAMPSGGQLYVKTMNKGTNILITISDTGVGMSEQQIHRLGEPYYSTKEGKGTGLGMMVVYSIIRAMNGTISVKSEINKGTTFLISFPRKV
ncbi:sensor histidine kinase [Peribacillus glennii]|uniref:histidine kinase n=1 Tax=Peribacillus glennii TaxID=2303991 RepID=A0A372LJN9_9BACI|nr:HAMP domain-containing sensor histidine kinase [Peribacillus glennii]RFU66645.1 sensor histidine kinase [Peribacillus glennii]